MYMNRNMSIYDKLTELREKATQGEWAIYDKHGLMALGEQYGGGCNLIAKDLPKDDVEFIAAIHNAFPTLKAHHDAAQRLVEAVGSYVHGKSDGHDCDLCKALDEYRKTMKKI